MHVKHKSSIGLALSAILALATTPTAQAQITEYTSRADFQSAVSGLTSFTFDGNAPVGGLTMYPSGLTVNGVTFTGSTGRPLVVADPKLGSGNPFGGHQFLTDGSIPDGITVSALPAGTTAFGVDLTGFNGMGTVAVTANGQTFNILVGNGMGAAGVSTFIGLTSFSPPKGPSFPPLKVISFTHIQTNGTFGVDLNNVTLNATPAATNVVPESSGLVNLSAALLAVGLAGIILRARKRQKQS